MTEPCQRCGTRDEEWRDLTQPVTRDDGRVVYPHIAYPPPYVAEGVRCVGCAQATAEARSLAEANGGEMEPGVRVVLRRWNPAIDRDSG